MCKGVAWSSLKESGQYIYLWMVLLHCMHGHEELVTCDAGLETEVHASEAPRVQYQVVLPAAWAARPALAESSPVIPTLCVPSLDHSERAVPSATLSPDGPELELCMLP